MVRGDATADVENRDEQRERASWSRIGDANSHEYIRKEAENEPHQGIHSWK